MPRSGKPGTVPALPLAVWSLVLPLKPLAVAKSRLGGSTGTLRPGFALAFAQDTVAAALRCPVVGRVLVVTDDATAREALGVLGALVIADAPRAGLNAALAHGAAQAKAGWPDTPIAALSADLPALRPVELERVLAAARRHDRAFLADAAGVGTTLLAARPGVSLKPAFGGASRARHRASGAFEIPLAGVDSVRRDVDTGADLRAALKLGVGTRTAPAAAAWTALGADADGA